MGILDGFDGGALMRNPLFNVGMGLLSVPNQSTNPADVAWGPGIARGLMGWQHAMRAHTEMDLARQKIEMLQQQRQQEAAAASQQQIAIMQRRDQLRQLALQLGSEEGQQLAQLAAVPGNEELVARRLAAIYQPPEPSDFERRMQAMGIDTSTPEGQAAARALYGRQGTTTVNVDTGPKLPGGYWWKDPNNPTAGVVPLPGGPADPQAEAAAAGARTTATETARLQTAKQALPNAIAAYREAFKEGGIPGTPGYTLANDAKENLAVQIAVIESRGAEPNANKIEQVLERIPDYAGFIDRPRFEARMKQLERLQGMESAPDFTVIGPDDLTPAERAELEALERKHRR